MLWAGGLLGLLAAPAAGAQEAARVGYPNSIAAAGDSSTTAALSGVLAPEVWENSWATGDNARVQSHYLRVLAANPQVRDHVFNAAISGQRMRHLEAQARRVVARQPEYVLVLMGANDACASAEAEMTSVEDYRAGFAAALATLSQGLPEARILVASVPDVYRLWELYRGDLTARLLWGVLGHCQAMLANPSSMAAADVERRERVRQRIRDYNRQLAEVCGQYLHCRYDNEALFSYRFEAEDVSTFDFFHPSERGQHQLAAVTWAAGYDFTDAVAPTSEARALPHPDGVQVELSATDDVQVAGLEFRDAAGGWQRYGGPLLRQEGELLTFRAVDVNGNVEATRTWRVTLPPPPPPEADGGGPDALAQGPGTGEDGAPPVGCGCTGGPGEAGALGLLALLSPWLRRPRAR